MNRQGTHQVSDLKLWQIWENGSTDNCNLFPLICAYKKAFKYGNNFSMVCQIVGIIGGRL